MMRLLAALAWAGVLLAQRKPVDDAWDLLIKGQRPDAVRLLREIIGKNPGDADARLLLGSVLQEDGDRAESIAQLTEAVRLRPRSVEAQYALGEAFNAFGAHKAARGPLTRAVALDPNFAPARVDLGLVLVRIYLTYRMTTAKIAWCSHKPCLGKVGLSRGGVSEPILGQWSYLLRCTGFSIGSTLARLSGFSGPDGLV